MEEKRMDGMIEQYPFLQELGLKRELSIDVRALPLEDEVYSYEPKVIKGRLHEEVYIVDEDGKILKEVVKEGERVGDALIRRKISNTTDCVVLYRTDFFPAVERESSVGSTLYIYDFNLSAGKRALNSMDNQLIGEAFEAYFDFRSGDTYHGGHKLSIIKELNAVLDLSSIEPEHVFHVVKQLRKYNPSKGTFVHYIDMNQLINFSKERPDEAVEAILGLFEEEESLTTRIENFRQKGREFREDSSFGTPLIAYVLTAFNHHQYTLYKDRPFQQFGKRFGLAIPRSIGEKYALYISLCKALLRYFRQSSYLKSPVIFDAQDFIYSTMKYDLL